MTTGARRCWKRSKAWSSRRRYTGEGRPEYSAAPNTTMASAGWSCCSEAARNTPTHARRSKQALRLRPVPASAATRSYAGCLSFLSSLGEELRNFLGGNRSFPQYPPARLSIRQVHDRRGDLAGRFPPVHNDRNPVLQLIPDGFGGGALRGSAQICRSRRDGNSCRLHHRQRDLRI